MDVPTVVNIRHCHLQSLGYSHLADWLARSDQHVYIGRNRQRYVAVANNAERSKWENPFPLFKHTRVDSLQRFEQHARQKLMDDLHELSGKVLGCWCHPDHCHGDILVKLYKERYIRR